MALQSSATSSASFCRWQTFGPRPMILLFFFFFNHFIFFLFEKVAPVGTNSDLVGRGRRLDMFLRGISLGDFSLVLVTRQGRLCHVISFFFFLKQTFGPRPMIFFFFFFFNDFIFFPFLRRWHNWQPALPRKTPRLIKSIFLGKDSGSRTAAHRASSNGKNAAYLRISNFAVDHKRSGLGVGNR